MRFPARKETHHQRRACLQDQRIDYGSRDASALARALGAAEADLADLKLRVQECLEREKRLIERALQAEEKLEDTLRNEYDLRDQIDRLVAFNRAVERSASWQLLQFLRGLVGRKW